MVWWPGLTSTSPGRWPAELAQPAQGCYRSVLPLVQPGSQWGSKTSCDERKEEKDVAQVQVAGTEDLPDLLDTAAGRGWPAASSLPQRRGTRLITTQSSRGDQEKKGIATCVVPVIQTTSWLFISGTFPSLCTWEHRTVLRKGQQSKQVCVVGDLPFWH